MESIGKNLQGMSEIEQLNAIISEISKRHVILKKAFKIRGDKYNALNVKNEQLENKIKSLESENERLAKLDDTITANQEELRKLWKNKRNLEEKLIQKHYDSDIFELRGIRLETELKKCNHKISYYKHLFFIGVAVGVAVGALLMSIYLLIE
jgi:chromosome segregation ATPase